MGEWIESRPFEKKSDSSFLFVERPDAIALQRSNLDEDESIGRIVVRKVKLIDAVKRTRKGGGLIVVWQPDAGQAELGKGR